MTGLTVVSGSMRRYCLIFQKKSIIHIIRIQFTPQYIIDNLLLALIAHEVGEHGGHLFEMTDMCRKFCIIHNIYFLLLHHLEHTETAAAILIIIMITEFSLHLYLSLRCHDGQQTIIEFPLMTGKFKEF